MQNRNGPRVFPKTYRDHDMMAIFEMKNPIFDGTFIYSKFRHKLFLNSGQGS